MFQVRIHGRGGQGVVTGAEMLSVAAFLGGQHAQAFPSFGSERMGAPVVAFCRIDDRPIRSHDPVVDVDALVIQDATLLHDGDLFSGLDASGYVLINTARPIGDLDIAGHASQIPAGHLLTVPATELAQRLIGRPVPNTVMLGGLAALTNVVPLEAVLSAIRRRFSGALGDANASAASAAAAYVHAEQETLNRA